MINRTAELQAIVNSSATDIDLKGETWPVSRLTLSVATSGKTIRNGAIVYAGPDGKPQYQLVEMVQGRSWNGVNYPAGRVNVTLDGVTLGGGFTFNCGLQEHNEKVAAEQGKAFNLIGPMTNKAGDVVLKDSALIECGGSGWGGSADSLTVINSEARGVAKHGLACPGFGGMRVSLQGYKAIDCGNGFDFSNPNKTYRSFLRPDTIEGADIEIRNPRGRTKFASPNWVGKLKRILIRQDGVISLNLFSGLDAAYNAHHLALESLTIINFVIGFGTLTDAAQSDGLIELRDSRFEGCFIPVKVQQRMTVDNVVMDGCYQKYQSGTPIERNVSVVNSQSAQYWASIFDQIEELYRVKNSEWGTSYAPLYWVPSQVRALMEQ